MRSIATRTFLTSICILSFGLAGCGTDATEDVASSEPSENNATTNSATGVANTVDQPKADVPVAVIETESESESEQPKPTLESALAELEAGVRISLTQSKQLVELSTEDPGNPLVVAAARKVMTDTRSPNWKRIQAMGELIHRHHLGSPELPGMCFSFYRVPGGEDILRSIADDSPDDVTRITAKFWLGYKLKREPEGLELLQEVVDFEGELPFRSSSLQAMATGPLNAAKLVVGKVAPEIVGKDIDGETFKLSDYRGKIVLLDFWGDW
jgi:hypothetical protein